MLLQVLYRFLELFSKFDWENFCLSLWGPVPLSSLPEITGRSNVIFPCSNMKCAPIRNM